MSQSGLAPAKRWFIAPYFAANGLAATYAGVRTVAGVARGADDTAAWAIAAGTHAAVLAYATRSWPRRDSPLEGLIGVTAAGTIALAVLLPDSAPALVPTAVLAGAGSLAYVGWYARYGRGPAAALRTGAPLPELTFRTLDGEPFRTADLRGAPAALFFFRGAWCPFAARRFARWPTDTESSLDRGVRVAMISPQPEAEARKLAERFGVEILWLRDADLSAARTLGLLDAGGVPVGVRGFGVDTVLPTLVVLDADGRTVLSDETDNYRLRPDASTVLAALDGIARRENAAEDAPGPVAAAPAG